jgi:hypothetical protein
LTKEIFSAASFVPVDMWTMLRTVCASHTFHMKNVESMEMLAFAHIPTGTTRNQVFLYSIGKKERKQLRYNSGILGKICI